MSTQVQEPAQTETFGIVAQNMSVFGHRVAICGLHFVGHKVQRQYRTRMDEGFNHVYELKAVEGIDDPPSVLWVYDGLERVYAGCDDYDHKKYVEVSDSSTAKLIAYDLIRHATGTDPAGPESNAPAYWISKADKIPQTKNEWALWGRPEFAKEFPKFAKECREYREREWRHCEGLVQVADGFFSEGGHRLMEINDRYRNAGKFIKAEQAEHPWIVVSSFGKTVSCPVCQQATPANAMRCGSCNEIINPVAYKKWKAAQEAELGTKVA